MKKGKISTNCFFSIWTLVLLVSFASCSAEGDSSYAIDDKAIDEAEVPFSIILKAYSENEDITSKGDVSNTTLYVFDKNNDFYKQITVDETYLLRAKPVQIDCPGSDRITVIAWSGVSAASETISSMNEANIISDLQLTLKQNNGIVSNFPDDLFHGQITLNRNITKSGAQELKISRKVASLTLTTKGLVKVFDSTEGTYFYKVKKSKSSFDHNGNLTGEDVEYIIPASVNKNGILVASSTPVLPTSNIVIELYKDNEMIISSENLKNSEKVSVNEGEQLCYSFDLSKKTSTIAVSSWGVIVNYAVVQ